MRTIPFAEALIAHGHDLEADPPDLVLVDLKLPDYQGLDAFAEVKVRAINIPVVALIDRSEAMLGPHLLQMGAADYLFRDALSAPLLEHVIQRAWERQRVQNNLSEYLQELYASEARFRTILQHYPDGLLILDAEGRILMANDEAQRLLGYAEAHLVGQPLEAFVREESPGFVRVLGAPGASWLRLRIISCEEDDPCQLVLLRPLTEAERQEMVALRRTLPKRCRRSFWRRSTKPCWWSMKTDVWCMPIKRHGRCWASRIARSQAGHSTECSRRLCRVSGSIG
ncbi:PAS domain S-box protein [Rhodothermus marinus]|uniref:PAS domain S-box protein n=1 Tax=Rhodothermus marinus TaxID=29549 RepID=UPI00396E41E7